MRNFSLLLSIYQYMCALLTHLIGFAKQDRTQPTTLSQIKKNWALLYHRDIDPDKTSQTHPWMNGQKAIDLGIQWYPYGSSRIHEAKDVSSNGGTVIAIALDPRASLRTPKAHKST
jgi:hypothetical protein